MALNILNHLTLAYQPVWGRQRRVVALRLRVRAIDPESVNSAHLIHLLTEDWPETAPPLIVSFADPQLLAQALELSPHRVLWLEMPDWGEFAPPEMVDRVVQALRARHQLLQCAPLARAAEALRQHPDTPLRYLLNLWPEDAALALKAAAERQQAAGRVGTRSPVLPGHLYQNLGSRRLADHVLDDQMAWGVCGWPSADVLDGYREYGAPVGRPAMLAVLDAVRDDASMETVVERVNRDPVLTYRMLRMVNSAVFGSGREVQSIRHALMLLGHGNLRRWLGEQLPAASDDADLTPVREAAVLRALLMEYLMEPGAETDLQEHIRMTGLFSTLDAALHQPLEKILDDLPLPQRVLDAVLRSEGPYFAYLDVARRMETAATMEDFPAICLEHEFQLDQVNRALLRMLAHRYAGASAR